MKRHKVKLYEWFVYSKVGSAKVDKLSRRIVELKAKKKLKTIRKTHKKKSFAVQNQIQWK